MNTMTRTTIVYTEEQQAAIDKLVSLIRARQHKEIRLVGQAGTGKSQSVKEIIRLLEEDDEDITIVAPTHKAKKVVANFINADRKEEDQYKCITLAKALGKIPDVKVENGQQILVQRKLVEKLQGVIIVDEASMISEEDLIKLCNLLTPESIILYILDPIQLPPINAKGDVPPVYDFTMPEATLTTPMRFYKDSNIGKLTSVMRNKKTDLSDVNWKRFGKFFKATDDINIYTDESLFLENLITDMTANNWQDNPNSVRCLSYTNRQVDRYNEYVKLEYFNNNNSCPSPGELYIAKSPFSRKTPNDTPNEIFAASKPLQFIQNGEEFTIIELLNTGTFTHPNYQHLPIDYERWSCLKEDGVQFVANLVHRKSEANYKKIDADLTNKAIKAKNYKAKKVAWAKRYAFAECFDDCKRAYALTVHSSQGSTFQHIYFDMSSMLMIPNASKIRRALCYTAMTRPTTSMSLYIPSYYVG